MKAKLYPYCREATCVKCGSQFITNPSWHMRGGSTYVSASLPFIHLCPGFALDHLHYNCQACGFAWAMACADVAESEGINHE